MLLNKGGCSQGGGGAVPVNPYCIYGFCSKIPQSIRLFFNNVSTSYNYFFFLFCFCNLTWGTTFQNYDGTDTFCSLKSKIN